MILLNGTCNRAFKQKLREQICEWNREFCAQNEWSGEVQGKRNVREEY